MIRNVVVSGVVAALMGGFVLALQAINPESQRPTMAEARTEDEPRPDSAVGGMDQAAQQPTSGAQPTPQAGQMPQQPLQSGATRGQAQPPAAQMMPGQAAMPMMGMCGQMMNMMMGGMGGQMAQPSQAQTGGVQDASQAALQRQNRELLEELRRLRQEVDQLKDAK